MDAINRLTQPTALAGYTRQGRDYNPYGEPAGRPKPAEAPEGRDFASILARMIAR